ncbi:zinc ribbon domain-containing protein [Mucilaginibacter sp. FT3.2]|uniref:zinc ribbon domain-containing protein n=1 Tax=Mucilaginibacter sp. FT3.2 TaxID=2723090 RepID=UPI00161738CC|nr:zinc ribbon domain-containing protein [Mucilaginibacter sp. FT3.2]MBB6233045.1 RNA polymerase subunit RPABC4/transcription elongation factor Spt4 [Mucilaginibacter sp. FT3.2]
MELLVCNNCESSVLNSSNFCNQCGGRLKCKECKSALEKGAKFCGECGTEINAVVASNGQPNTFHYYKKGDEIRCDVGLSNEVGKEGLKSLIENITQNSYPHTFDVSPINNGANQIEHQLPIEEAKNLESKNEVSEEKSFVNLNSVNQDKKLIKYLHIDDLLHKRKLSEMEWILIFAFYEGGYGAKTFTYDQVRSAYLNKRKNDSRNRNFSGNWTGLRKTFFDTASEGVFRIEFDKVDIVSDFVLGTASGIIKGAYENSKSPTSKKVTKEKPATATVVKASKSSKQIVLEDFDVVKSEKKPSLQEVFDKFKPSSNKDVFGLIAYYICELSKTETFTAGNIDYAYRILKLTRKNSLVQLINNVKNETQWFEGIESGKWKLSRLGSVALEEMFRL